MSFRLNKDNGLMNFIQLIMIFSSYIISISSSQYYGDLCITSSQQSHPNVAYILGTYVWSSFNPTTNSSTYLGPHYYLYEYMWPAGTQYWYIGSNVSSLWISGLCELYNIADIAQHSCVGNWRVYNGSSFELVPDMKVRKCSDPTDSPMPEPPDFAKDICISGTPPGVVNVSWSINMFGRYSWSTYHPSISGANVYRCLGCHDHDLWTWYLFLRSNQSHNYWYVANSYITEYRNKAYCGEPNIDITNDSCLGAWRYYYNGSFIIIDDMEAVLCAEPTTTSVDISTESTESNRDISTEGWVGIILLIICTPILLILCYAKFSKREEAVEFNAAPQRTKVAIVEFVKESRAKPTPKPRPRPKPKPKYKGLSYKEYVMHHQISHPINKEPPDWIKELIQTEMKTDEIDRKYRIKYTSIRRQSDCKISECTSLHRICDILQRHHSMESEELNVDSLYVDIYKDNTRDLLNDYNHLLLGHSDEFESIHDNLSEINNLKCPVSKCLIFRRNCDHDKNKDLYVDAENDHSVVRQQFLDRVHSHYLHSFDIGYKLTERDKQIVGDHDSLTKFIQNKQKHYDDIPEIKRKRESKKFYDTFSYGERFFYWKFYKYQSRTTDPATGVDPGLAGSGFDNQGIESEVPLKHWYVGEPESKSGDVKVADDHFKMETLQSLDMSRWKQLVVKAEKYIETDVAREISICPRRQSAKCYDMKADQEMQTHHLIAVMLYCNFDDLSTKFSATFRQIERNDFVLIKRHKKYYYFARYLREAVECFGMKQETYKQHVTLYHGTNNSFKFPSMNAFIKGPFSTTSDYAVAVNFCANKGLILELNMNVSEWVMPESEAIESNARLCCWDCCWLSDFSQENEILFVGGSAKLSFNTILNVNGTNYWKYVRGLKQMTYCMSNGDLRANSEAATTKAEKQMVFRLLSHELFRYAPQMEYAHPFKSCPEYFQQILHAHCTNIKTIAFLNRDDESVIHEKFFKDRADWINMDLLYMIFPKIEDIQFVAREKHMLLVKNGTIFEKILRFIPNSKFVLRSVSIILDQELTENQLQEIDKLFEKYRRFFDRFKWKITRGTVGTMNGGKKRIKILVYNWGSVAMSIRIDHGDAGMSDMEFLQKVGEYEIRMFAKRVLITPQQQPPKNNNNNNGDSFTKASDNI